jgi:hypothetical protein
MAGRLSSGAVAAGLIGLRKPAGGGGGGSAYDVTPPAATTQAKAAGASLTAHTFGAFGGADAGSIDGYTARIVNATGSTSWSGSGLGAWTPSADADGDAGVLALDATIGGVVVATALHDYSRAAAGAGGGLEALVDISGIASYDFLTAGAGTHVLPSGPGGSNQNWLLDYRSTSGPTVLRITSGVLEFEGSVSARGLLSITMSAGGYQTGRHALMFYVSIDNMADQQGMTWYIGQNQAGVNAGNEAQFLPGMRGNGVINGLSMYTRENTTSSPAFTTVRAWNDTLTDLRTTPTRMACRLMGGSWQPSYDQGTAALPTDGDNLSAHSGKQYNDFSNTSTPQNRNYWKLNLFGNVDVRLVAYKGTL